VDIFYTTLLSTHGAQFNRRKIPVSVPDPLLVWSLLFFDISYSACELG